MVSPTYPLFHRTEAGGAGPGGENGGQRLSPEAGSKAPERKGVNQIGK